MSNKEQQHVELEARNFQTTIDGKPVDLYTLRNANGMVVKITNYGSRIEQVLVPDKRGVVGDVVLGYDTIEGVRSGRGSMGGSSVVSQTASLALSSG